MVKRVAESLLLKSSNLIFILSLLWLQEERQEYRWACLYVFDVCLASSIFYLATRKAGEVDKKKIVQMLLFCIGILAWYYYGPWT